MPSTDVLQQFGLSRNPFTDRTAEKTFLDGTSLYVHSDLQGFQPSGKANTRPACCQRRASGLWVPNYQLAWLLRIPFSVMWLELQRRPTSSLASGALGRRPSGCRCVCVFSGKLQQGHVTVLRLQAGYILSWGTCSCQRAEGTSMAH